MSNLFGGALLQSGSSANWYGNLHQLGLANSSLKLCVDAGDIVSYPGYGDLWLDLSGRDQHLVKGDNGATPGTPGADTTDYATFVGTPGRQTAGEYFQTDGGDHWTISSAVDTTWGNNLHKNNAKFTFASWFNMANNTVDAQTYFATFARGNNTTRGAALYSIGSNLTYEVDNGTVFSFTLGSVIPIGWFFMAVSVDEAAQVSIIRGNNQTTTSAAAYSSPSASSASGLLTFWKNTNENFALRSPGGMANMAFWEGYALSATELANLYTLTRPTYGTPA